MIEKKELSSQPTVEQEILNELKKMNKLMTIAEGQKIEETLGRYATSDERKMIWALMDGRRQAPEMAQVLKMTKDAVNKFLQSLESAGLVEKREYGKPPVRAIDYVPASWVDLSSKSAAPAEQKQTQQEAGAVG